MGEYGKGIWQGISIGLGVAAVIIGIAWGGPCTFVTDQRLANLERADEDLPAITAERNTAQVDLRDCQSQGSALANDLSGCRTLLAATGERQTDPTASAEIVGDRNLVMQGSPGGSQVQVDVDRRWSLDDRAKDQVASRLRQLPSRDFGVLAPGDGEAQRLKLQIISALKAGGWQETYRVGQLVAPAQIGISVGSNSELSDEHKKALAPLFAAVGQEPTFQIGTGRPERGERFVTIRIGIRP